MRASNTDNCVIYVRFEYFALSNTQQVELYKDPDMTQLIAIGQGFDVPTPMTLEERNSSGMTGTVVWDGTPVTYVDYATLTCSEFNSSSSSSSSPGL